jgi:hypothetical protein
LRDVKVEIVEGVRRPLVNLLRIDGGCTGNSTEGENDYQKKCETAKHDPI